MVKSGVSNRDICQFVTVGKIRKPLQTLTCHDVTVGSPLFPGCRGEEEQGQQAAPSAEAVCTYPPLVGPIRGYPRNAIFLNLMESRAKGYARLRKGYARLRKGCARLGKAKSFAERPFESQRRGIRWECRLETRDPKLSSAIRAKPNQSEANRGKKCFGGRWN